MLDNKGFKKSLASLALTQSKFKALAQELAIFCIDQNHKQNTNFTLELVKTLLKPDGKKAFKKDGKEEMRDVFKYSTNDARRIMEFIVHFSPVSINSELGTVKYQAYRVDKGCVPLKDETMYPLWHEWAKAEKTGAIEVKDGVEAIEGVLSSLLGRIKRGTLVIDADTSPVFERLVDGIAKLVATEKAAISKVLDAQTKTEVTTTKI